MDFVAVTVRIFVIEHVIPWIHFLFCFTILSRDFSNLKIFRYEKSGHLIGNEYFLHAYGPIYALSAEVVASLATARNNRFVFLKFCALNFDHLNCGSDSFF